MYKEIIIVLIIIVLIITLEVVTQNYTKYCITTVSDRLENLSNEFIEEKNDTDKIDSENVLKDWKLMNENLAYYIEHDELEKVSTSLTKINGYYNQEENDEAIVEINNCIFILKHIQDKNAIKFVNLF